MKSSVLTLLLCICFCFVTYGQIKIGNNPQSIDPSSVLELESTSHVLVITRVTTAEMNAIIPKPGGLVYNTDTECVHYFNGLTWGSLCEASGALSNLTTQPKVNPFSTIIITPDGETNHIEVGFINGNQIQPNTLNGSSISNNSITSEELESNSVTSNEIDNRTIQPIDIANASANQILGTDATGTANWINAASIIGANADGTTITGDGSGTPLALSGTVIASILANTTANANDTDGNATNEIQNITLVNNTLAISDGDTVDLTSYLDNTDEQDLSLSGNTINITGGQGIDIEDLVSFYVNPNKISGTGETLDPYTIAPNAITSAEILNEIILSEDILDGTITGNDISNGNITPIKIEPATLPLTENQVLTTNISGSVQWSNIEDNQNDTEILLANPTDYDGDSANETTVQEALAAILSITSDDQNDTEILLATPTDYNGDSANETTVEEALNALNSIANQNLSNTDLTQTTGQDRSYDLNGQDLFFTGTGKIGIGTTSPESKLHILGGQVRAATFSAGNGIVSYRFSDDPNTGMWRDAADELAFSAGGIEGLRIDEASNLTQTTISNSLATSITKTSTDITLNRSHHTVILEIGVTNITLPGADTDNQGRIYILKNLTGGLITVDDFIDSDGGTPETSLGLGVTQLQSDGTNWQQIN